MHSSPSFSTFSLCLLFCSPPLCPVPSLPASSHAHPHLLASSSAPVLTSPSLLFLLTFSALPVSPSSSSSYPPSPGYSFLFTVPTLSLLSFFSLPFDLSSCLLSRSIILFYNFLLFPFLFSQFICLMPFVTSLSSSPLQGSPLLQSAHFSVTIPPST